MLKKSVRKKIVMVMGVQRSGTNALFDALSHGRITGFNESISDYVYDGYYLRPESELRAIFEEVPGAILLKPISETLRRSVRAVFAEYAAYDLHVVWIYRDPVNAAHSQLRLGFSGPPSTVPELAELWNQRNQSVLDALPFHADHLTIVRYEDLADFPCMLAAIGECAGIEAFPNFRADSGGGRREMAPEMQHLTDAVTRETRMRMDAARTVLPRMPALSSPIAGPDIYSPAFIADPYRHFREWRERANVHRLYQPNSWLVLNYEDVAAILCDTQRFSTAHYRALSLHFGGGDPSSHARLRRILDPHFTPEFMRLQTTRIEHHARRLLEELSGVVEFDLVADFASRLTTRLAAEHSRAPSGSHSRTPAETQCPLLAEVAADSQLTESEVEGLRRFIPVAGYVLIPFIGNAMQYLLVHPEFYAELRCRPADIPAFAEEMLRLATPTPTLRRMTLCPMRIAGVEIPAEAHVYPAIGAANRDPEQYQQPDEMILHRPGPPHLSFSIGPNACLGRHLGQLECETAIRVLLTEFPRLRLTCPHTEIRFIGSPRLYGPDVLPVRFDSSQ